MARTNGSPNIHVVTANDPHWPLPAPWTPRAAALGCIATALIVAVLPFSLIFGGWGKHTYRATSPTSRVYRQHIHDWLLLPPEAELLEAEYTKERGLFAESILIRFRLPTTRTPDEWAGLLTAGVRPGVSADPLRVVQRDAGGKPIAWADASGRRGLRYDSTTRTYTYLANHD